MDENPYAAPQSVAKPPVTAAELSLEDAQELRTFRNYIHAYAVISIVFGCYALIPTAMVLLALVSGADTIRTDILAVSLVVGLPQLAIGVLAFSKQTWAIYMGLVFYYLALIANLFQLNLCGMAVWGVIIVIAHRVINQAKELRALGIPLTLLPVKTRR